jgi:P27 family predicted phage terminase small subunit
MWDHLAPQLYKAGLLIDAYREVLEMLCDSFGRWAMACEKLDAEGMTAPGSTGNTVKSPWVSIRNDMWTQFCKGAACFGLTPADISSVQTVVKPTTEQTKQRFFGGNG